MLRRVPACALAKTSYGDDQLTSHFACFFKRLGRAARQLPPGCEWDARNTNAHESDARSHAAFTKLD